MGARLLCGQLATHSMVGTWDEFDPKSRSGFIMVPAVAWPDCVFTDVGGMLADAEAVKDSGPDQYPFMTLRPGPGQCM